MRKRFIAFLFLIFFMFPIYGNASTNRLDRNSLENYGVHKHWDLTKDRLRYVMDTYAVNADEKIYDYSDVLTDEEENELYSKISDFIEKYHTEIVIVTVNLPYSDDKVNEDWAADFYDYNDFGLHFSNYSGILLLRNTYEDDPYYNMYMFGDAQLYIDYNRSEAILDDIYDSLHNGLYLDGFQKFITDLEYDYLSGIPSSRKNYYVNHDGYLVKEYHAPWGAIVLIDFFIVLIVMLVLRGKNKMVKKKLNTSEYFDKKSLVFHQVTERFVRTYTTRHDRSSSSGGGGGSSFGGSSSGSSGGGHSSGGGRHG